LYFGVGPLDGTPSCRTPAQSGNWRPGASIFVQDRFSLQLLRWTQGCSRWMDVTPGEGAASHVDRRRQGVAAGLKNNAGGRGIPAIVLPGRSLRYHLEPATRLVVVTEFASLLMTFVYDVDGRRSGGADVRPSATANEVPQGSKLATNSGSIFDLAASSKTSRDSVHRARLRAVSAARAWGNSWSRCDKMGRG